MSIVLLIRHGENEYVKKGRLAGRLPGIHLNKNGHKQAQAIAKFLEGAPIKAVYSSPLDRTMETALPIAKAGGLEVIPRAGLLEVDYGEWENKKLKKLNRKRLWRVVQSAPSRMIFPGGESFIEAQHRVCHELDNLVRQHNPKDIFVCVSHSDLIKLAVTYYIGLPLDMFQRLHISPASITALRMSEIECDLLVLNYDISLTLQRK